MTVTYPDAVRRALKQNRTISKPPKLTAKAPTLIKWQGVLIQIGIMLILLAILSVNSNLRHLAVLVLVIGSVIIILQVRWQWRTFSQREKAYQVRVTSYLRALESFGISEANCGSENLLANTLQQYEFVYQINPDRIPDNLVKLDQLLHQRLNEKIHHLVLVPIGDSTFQLDWAYIEPSLNLHMAILIYNSSPLYLSVQQLLLKTGWILLEFGENELIDLPEESVETVLKTINHLLSN